MTPQKEKTIGIIVARLTSSRLPGKSLRFIHDKPLVGYILERLRLVNGLDEIWLATTQHPSDEKLVQWAVEQGINVFTYPGEIDDLVGRISAVVKKADADRFIYALGDTPFPDPRLLNRFIEELDKDPELPSVHLHQMKNSVHTGIACFRTWAWEKIDAESQEPKYREHLASILTVKKDLINGLGIKDDPIYYERSYRLTIDTHADLEMITDVVRALAQPDHLITPLEIIEFLDQNPDIAGKNQHVRQKTIDDKPINILMAIQMGEESGFTHLERCKSMARSLEENFSAGVTFWIDSFESRNVPTEYIGRKVIEGGWSLPESIRQRPFDKLVIDFRKKIAPTLIQSIRIVSPEIPIIVVDNTGLGAMEADALVLPNSHTEEPLGYQGDLYRGAAYTLLGDDFLYGNLPTDDQIETDKPYILIAMGSRDPFDLTQRALEALSDIRDCHLDIVVPPHFRHPENLEKIATRMPSTVTIHWRLNNLRLLMSRSTFSISVFGLTAYELAYLGVPALLYCNHVEELDDLKNFVRYGTAELMGDAKGFDAENLLTKVKQFLDDRQSLAKMSEQGKKLVDHDAAINVSEAIMATTRKIVPSTL